MGIFFFFFVLSVKNQSPTMVLKWKQINKVELDVVGTCYFDKYFKHKFRLRLKKKTFILTGNSAVCIYMADNQPIWILLLTIWMVSCLKFGHILLTVMHLVYEYLSMEICWTSGKHEMEIYPRFLCVLGDIYK